MPLTQTAEYALRAAVCLAQGHDALIPTTEIARQAGVPQNYLAKVLQTLAGAEIIAGRRGVGGGYRLAREPAQVSLLDIVRAVGELDQMRRCPIDPTITGGLCALHTVLDDEKAHMIKTLGGTTLGDLLARGTPLCAHSQQTPPSRARLPSAP